MEENKNTKQGESLKEKMKRWIIYAVVFIGIAFMNGLIKTLVAESHKTSKVETKYNTFDKLMRDQVKKMNAQLPIRIDEYTTCTDVSYTTSGGRKMISKYRLADEAIEYAMQGSAMQEIKNEMIRSMRVQYPKTKEITTMMIECGMIYKYEYYDRHGKLINSYILHPREIVY